MTKNKTIHLFSTPITQVLNITTVYHFPTLNHLGTLGTAPVTLELVWGLVSKSTVSSFLLLLDGSDSLCPSSCTPRGLTLVSCLQRYKNSLCIANFGIFLVTHWKHFSTCIGILKHHFYVKTSDILQYFHWCLKNACIDAPQKKLQQRVYELVWQSPENIFAFETWMAVQRLATSLISPNISRCLLTCCLGWCMLHCRKTS